MKVKLTQLKAGQTGRVLTVEGGAGAIRNMENIGVRPNKKIKKISQQLGRGPVIIQSGQSEIAIGYGLAQKILVETEE